MSDFPCPFCDSEHLKRLIETPLVIGCWDRFPVTPGHALVVTRRHVEDWFAATREERHALMDAVDLVKACIEQTHQPHGYNIGVNVGSVFPLSGKVSLVGELQIDDQFGVFAGINFFMW